MLKSDVGCAYAAVTIAFAAGLPPFDRAQGRLRQAQDIAQGAPSGASRALFPHPQSRSITPPSDHLVSGRKGPRSLWLDQGA